MGFRYTYQNFMMEELIPRSNKSKNCNAQKITYKNANRHDTFWRYKNIALIDFDCADIEIRFLMFPRIQIHYPGNASGMPLKSGIHGQPSPNWPGIFKILFVLVRWLRSEIFKIFSSWSVSVRDFQILLGCGPVLDFSFSSILVLLGQDHTAWPISIGPRIPC